MPSGKFLKGTQTINGKLGEVWFNIDGVIRLAMEIKKVSAKLEMTKKDIPVIGDMANQIKYTGWKGTGSCTSYYTTSYFREAMIRYARTGIAPVITLTIVVDDEGSGRGVERTTLGKVVFDSVELAKLSAEDEVLEEELPFTFSEILNYEGFDSL